MLYHDSSVNIYIVREYRFSNKQNKLKEYLNEMINFEELISYLYANDIRLWKKKNEK